jgi:hypothetical protein
LPHVSTPSKQAVCINGKRGSYFTAQHAALIYRISGPDFFQPVHKYRMHQRVTGFTFIQPREVPPAAVRVVLPEITDF